MRREVAMMASAQRGAPSKTTRLSAGIAALEFARELFRAWLANCFAVLAERETPMLVYRDAVRRAAGPAVCRRLLQKVGELGGGGEGLLALLLEAGEIEAALEDAGALGAPAARQLTDALADAWIGGVPLTAPRLQQRVEAVVWPSEIVLKRPEGYAYYALDPAGHARALLGRDFSGRRVVVVGIRSIGTSASAIVRAALASVGASCLRFSVRPDGHPWDRRCAISEPLASIVAGWRDADYFVVDEGPGLSGSTFLAVAERLELEGVPRQRIELLTSHEADPRALCAPRAAERWARFTATAAVTRAPIAVATDASAGDWRRLTYSSEAEWPAVWPLLERRKYLSVGGRELLKFCGFPPYGEAPTRRGQELAEAGFSPPLRPHSAGYTAQPWAEGAPLASGAPRSEMVPRLLDYLVFRHAAFRADDVDSEALETMLRVNLAEALGRDAPAALRLELERPVYSDARLLPHEWIGSRGKPALKVDATDHADDHLFPGPCDSAWDVAGAIVEWELTEAEAADFVQRYEARSGDRVGRRLPAHVLAYAAFRSGYCQLAALASPAAERMRLERDRERYSDVMRRVLARDFGD